jgi:S1-C subfamily serine protease
VVISPQGLVLTIGYLILEAQDIALITQDGKRLPATLVAYDLATGFGLVKPVLPWADAASVPLGTAQSAKAGDTLMAAVGATQDGKESDVSLTQLVGQRPFSGSWEYHIDQALFTSPPVLAGRGNHSGAALFNQKGELLGIGSLLVSDAAGGGRRLPGNMFVPVDLLKPILGEMQASGSSHLSHRPWLGLTSTDQGGRVQVLRVNEDSPAQEAGLKSGDVVLAVDEDNVASLEVFYKKLWTRASPQTPVRLTVLQGADIKTVVVQPRDRMQTLRKPAVI